MSQSKKDSRELAVFYYLGKLKSRTVERKNNREYVALAQGHELWLDSVPHLKMPDFQSLKEENDEAKQVIALVCDYFYEDVHKSVELLKAIKLIKKDE